MTITREMMEKLLENLEDAVVLLVNAGYSQQQWDRKDQVDTARFKEAYKYYKQLRETQWSDEFDRSVTDEFFIRWEEKYEILRSKYYHTFKCLEEAYDDEVDGAYE